MHSIIDRLADVSDRYDAAFVDLWGCLHNGREPFPAAVAALHAFVAKGGYVVLLTNAPRPQEAVIMQLGKLDVPPDIWHAVVTSGDSTRAAVAAGRYGQKVFHLGPEKDSPFFAASAAVPGMERIRRVALEDAQGIVCTGLFDDRTETPEDYAALLHTARIRGLPMICANPDIAVDFGHKRRFCAGALAQAYRDRGGEVCLFGKPHRPIYALARRCLAQVSGRVIPDARILGIGDGILTDVSGAARQGLDSLFISGGLAAAETGTDRSPAPGKLAVFLQAHDISPTFTIGHLR
ncbi:MAG: TIGR01459 family HAD-type hydrolase [Rhodobacteraceae bacterium]|nr:TIGR01459 family HAD-type hydrolase [Paracoccaceae bacterium]